MLDPSLITQLKTYLANVRVPITLIATLDDGAKSAELRTLLETIAPLSDKISVRFDGQETRCPAFVIARDDGSAQVTFAAIPLGHEFSSLVLALLHIGGHPPREDDALLDQVRGLDKPLSFEVFISLSCHNCPEVVQALNAMAALNPRIRTTIIDGALFRDEVEARGVMAVPMVLLNGEPFGQGRMTLAEIVAKVDTHATERVAEALDNKPPYDVLVVGGGPAAAAAAIYAARKGIRTGLVADRIGGQVLDTMGIENFISVLKTDGPKLAGALADHIGDYAVDVMKLQRAAALTPGEAGGLHSVTLESGATLKAKTVILATGARWRLLGVPGEDTYRNRGVAYCPHCDGPLFKGKRVAVIGGGNSGVEAAIDLAGLAAHVTLVEFDDQLRADAVLQEKLASLTNTRVILSAQSSEVVGDGHKVTGLRYRDRASGEDHEIELDGIFVQIGLVPNSEWLDGAIARSARGEIEIDDRCATSRPGVFAAGDVTTVPYKQIVIAAGEGAKAALSAFDHLIRS